MAKNTNPNNKTTPPQPARAANPVAAVTPSKMPGVKMLCLLLAIIAFLTYSGTFNHSYVLDDLMIVHGNNLVTKGVNAIPEILTTPYLHGYAFMPNDVYRPISLVTLAIETQLFGISPTANHAMNVLFFVGCVVFLFLFLYNLFEGKKALVAFIATLLFAVHPIHTEVVANVKSRDELLCFMFGFLALFQFTKYAKSGKVASLAIGAFCFLLSLLSKETSIAFLAIIPLVFLAYLNDDKKKSIHIIASSFAVAVLFLVFRFVVLKQNHADDPGYLHFIDNQLVSAPGYASRLATAILVLGSYIKLMVVPYPLICSYAFNSIPTVSFGNIWVLLSLVVYAGLFAFAIFRLVNKGKDPIAFGILFFIITLAITSNIFFLIASVMAERFLFFASVGFCLVIAVLLEGWVTKNNPDAGQQLWNPKMWMVLAPVAIILAVLSVNRNAEWKDNFTLFTADVEKAPSNARLNFYLGNEMGNNYADQAPDLNTKNQIIDQSIPYLQKAVAVYPHFYDAHVALGTAFFKLKRFDSAERHYKLGLADDPTNILAYNGLAGIYFMNQNFTAARDILVKDVALNPRNTSVVHNLGLCYMNMKMYDSTIYYAHMVLSMDPHHIESFKNLAISYNELHQLDSFKKYEALALQK